jgi:trehalose/maltose hydrolase-like predicted phosphorylase
MTLLDADRAKSAAAAARPGRDSRRGWRLRFRDSRLTARVVETLLTVSDGRFGTRGSVEEDGEQASPTVLAAGVYEDDGDNERLVSAPLWTRVAPAGTIGASTWLLDMRRGTVLRTAEVGDGQLTSIRFASLARPGWMALRVEGPLDVITVINPLTAPAGAQAETGASADGQWMLIRTNRGGGVVAAADDEVTSRSDRGRLDRLAVYVADADSRPDPAVALTRVARASDLGFDRLLDEHTAAWNQRWENADIEIDGAEPELQAAVRFCLFHLIAASADDGETAVGARGLSGPNYSGHVFWDADVFVLPFLAATHPSGARAMLQYRIERLTAARAAAEQRGLDGVRFPWESAASGRDVTPRIAHTPDARIEPIYAGEYEEHITADVAWACMQYVAWTGDHRFLDGDGRTLLRDTANYWASRIRRDRHGVGHLYGVVGPDEYHDIVDDNAFTNAMARWNLRTAASVERAHGHDSATVDTWESLAAALFSCFDPARRRHEQFDGYDRLEPLLADQLSVRPPVAADLLLGRQRVRASQLVKQPDVLMAHHLIPEHMEPGSLDADLDYYLPRTVHGSSLSPAICAALLARAGRPDDALPLFRLAARIDLDDLTGTTAGGLHLAAMGGVWQALVTGFLGVRPDAEHLVVEPHLPSSWQRVKARVRHHGVAVRISASHDGLRFDPAGEITVRLSGDQVAVTIGREGATFVRHGDSWSRSS